MSLKDDYSSNPSKDLYTLVKIVNDRDKTVEIYSFGLRYICFIQYKTRSNKGQGVVEADLSDITKARQFLTNMENSGLI
jgi:hypothetical protein